MKFLGAPYPIKKTPLGLLATQHGLNQIKSDLLVLLMTNPGERCMLPDFGTPLRTLLFEPNDQIIADRATEMIIESITQWEPRITVKKIEVFVEPNLEEFQDDNGNVLYIKIMFHDPEEIQEIQELQLKLPLGNLRENNEQLSI
jgi:phage baseplate assembly protein W